MNIKKSNSHSNSLEKDQALIASPQVEHSSVTTNTILGTSKNDDLTGTNGNDYIYGDDGDDEIYGTNGYDYLDGGNGDDYIVVGKASTATGGNGSDTFYAVINPNSVNGGESGIKGYHSLITDFTQGEDVIDINVGKFNSVKEGVSHDAHTLGYHFENGQTIIQSADSATAFKLTLSGEIHLNNSDFVSFGNALDNIELPNSDFPLN